jgi:hypothetical protein
VGWTPSPYEVWKVDHIALAVWQAQVKLTEPGVPDVAGAAVAVASAAAQLAGSLGGRYPSGAELPDWPLQPTHAASAIIPAVKAAAVLRFMSAWRLGAISSR